MFRHETHDSFVFDTWLLQFRHKLFPVHQGGVALFICNYSTAQRQVFVDQSADGTAWVNIPLTGTSIVVPYGVGVAMFYPQCNQCKYLRVRLDARADGGGVYVRLESPAPTPDHNIICPQ